MPVDGTMKDQSHVVTDPVSSKKICGVRNIFMFFSPSQVTITVATENGNTLSGTTVNVNVSGTILYRFPECLYRYRRSHSVQSSDSGQISCFGAHGCYH